MKIHFLLVLFIWLNGCSLFQPKQEPVKPISILATEVKIPVFHPPMPDSIIWRDFKWKILTPERMSELLDAIERGEEPARAFYALTTDQYEVLTLNMAEIKQFLKQQRAIIEYYHKNVNYMAVEKEPLTYPSE